MYNANIYNAAVYNGEAAVSGPADQDSIVFNSFSLQNSNIVSSILLYDSTPSRDLPTNKIPRNDGEFILGDFWRQKVITVSGVVKGSSASNFESRVDDMKKALAVRERNLDITLSDSSIRRFKASLINGNRMFDQRKHYHIDWMPFAAQFLCIIPWGESTTYQEDLFVGKTDLSSTEFTNNAGTIHARPIFTLNFLAASGITAISITNNTRLETISTTTAITAGDIVVFDGEEFTVTKNGTRIDFSGFFPKLDTGSNSITITLTGTSVTYTLSIKHKTPFL